jgi:hypothetical protein
MRAVQITRFGGPEVQELVDVLQPDAGPAQQLYDVSTAGVNYADTHPRRDRFQSPSGSSPSITRPGSAPGGFSRRRSRPATADRIGAVDMGEATVGTGTRTAVSGDERPFLPGMSREWLPPLYDPLTRLLGVHRRLLDRDGRPP